ncbi:MAG TPA: carboxypeptidase regulatory-like domain-containing protein, partial [Bryobacterales bacterium]|nr:carboxypeptidase regulatory-like domain-containing protein [Bryobacterales bacterium]
MKHACRWVLVSALTLAGLGAAPQAEPEAAGEPKGKVGGIVISAKTGEALRGARVTLQPNGRGMRRESRAQTTTDLNGHFLLTEVAAGRYTILAEKTAYETRQDTRMGSTNLAQDESRTDLVIRLRPAAVITGKVLDSYGEPVARATVAALQRNYVPGQPGLTLHKTALSDDLGEYRLYGLAMGKYIIGVNPPEEPAPKGAFVYEQLPAYYPGTTDSDEATVLKVTWGTELQGVDIRLAAAPATAVSGFVGDGVTGEPLEAYVLVVTEQGGRLGSFSTTENGRFALYGLPAKSLFIEAMSRRGRE